MCVSEKLANEKVMRKLKSSSAKKGTPKTTDIL